MRFLKTIFTGLVLAALASAIIFVGANHFSKNKVTIVEVAEQAVKNTPLASFVGVSDSCKFPMLWSVGRIDSGFNVSRSEMETAVDKAAALWDSAVGKNLFAESPTGALKIGLIYDERQKETDFLAKMGLTIDQSKESFDSLQASYLKLQKQYDGAKVEYQTLADNFAAAQTALNAKIQYWNEHNGAPPSEYATIQQEQSSQKSEFDQLEQKRAALNANAEDLNNLAAVVNQMAKELNIKVAEYNSGGNTVRNVFEAGVYESDQAGRRIFVYQFENKARLTSVLAHELGHALGLEHNENKSSIMYRLNQGESQNITASDIAALKKECPNLK